MPIKEYSKTGRSCRVTFELPVEVNAQTACLCSDFNDWNESSHPMKRAKDGSFKLTVSLKPGREYRYRFLLDGERWGDTAHGRVENPDAAQRFDLYASFDSIYIHQK